MPREKLSAPFQNGIPSLNALRAFEVAGRHLNFRKASEELRVTAGAVSQQIRKLESELGIALFVRGSDGLSLTRHGRSYHRQIIDIFEDLRQASTSLRPAPSGVTISVTPTVASKWLIPRLPEFAALHPDIDVRILATERVLSFRSEPIDLVIRQSASAFGSGVKAVALFRQELVAICAPDIVAGQSLPLSNEQIASLPLLHDSGDFWVNFLTDNLDTTLIASHGLKLGSTGLCLDAALAGQGVALASRFLVSRELLDGRLVQVTPRSMTGPETYYALRRRDAPARSSVDALHDWLLSQSDE